MQINYVEMKNFTWHHHLHYLIVKIHSMTKRLYINLGLKTLLLSTHCLLYSSSPKWRESTHRRKQKRSAPRKKSQSSQKQTEDRSRIVNDCADMRLWYGLYHTWTGLKCQNIDKTNMGIMNKLWLDYYPIQLRLANLSKVLPIGRHSQVPVDVEGLRTNADFNFIDFVDDKNPYPSLLGIDWTIDN